MTDQIEAKDVMDRGRAGLTVERLVGNLKRRASVTDEVAEAFRDALEDEMQSDPLNARSAVHNALVEVGLNDGSKVE